MWYLKLILIMVLAAVLYQDYKNRLVYWFLYPVIGVLAFFIQLHYLPIQLVLSNTGLNLIFITILLGVSFIYTRFRNLPFQEAIGLGDILYFIFIALTFSVVSFIVLFVFALLFSLLLHFFFQNKNQLKTVPLAGYMALFFGVVYAATFFCNSNFLYAY